MIRVNSSAMTAVGYDPLSRRMKITFTAIHMIFVRSPSAYSTV
jgi:hypothetical protein